MNIFFSPRLTVNADAKAFAPFGPILLPSDQLIDISRLEIAVSARARHDVSALIGSHFL